MQDWIDGHRRDGVQPVFANPSRTVVRQLNSAGMQDIIGAQFIVVRMADAVRLCQVRSFYSAPLIKQTSLNILNFRPFFRALPFTSV